MNDLTDPHHTLALESPSELFHEASKLRESDGVTAKTVWCVNTSPQIKEVISNPATSHPGFPTLALPMDHTRPNRPLHEVLLGRRSARKFSGEPLSLLDLSAILYYGAGVTESVVDSYGITWGFRCAPSGGALYPIDIYCLVMNVDGAEEGLHAYDSKAHTLELLVSGKYIDRLSAATYLAETMDTASVCILMVANFPRSKFKYGERAYRFVLLEAGHVAQNMLLVATSIGLGSLPLGGYVDDQVNDMVGIDGCDRAVVYSVVVGRVANTVG